MHIEVISALSEADAKQWNALVQDNNPFVRHEFLSALETNQCVGEHFGWLPRHVLLYRDDELIGAMPLYEKYNNYGEFVFDHAWADAYQRHGMDYYPKLVSAIPYTPASGQRLLAKSGEEEAVYPLLLHAAQHLCGELNASGFHCLFPESGTQDWLEKQNTVTRHDCQFHWHNFEYQCFDDFLATLSAKKRKNIRQERRKVRDAGVKLRCLDGHSATMDDWKQFAFFYQHNFEKKWGMPTLNEGFFRAVATALPDQVFLVLADQNGECRAGALMFCSDTRLFGRHWGCTEYFDSLHFEACYYQGIEYCIKHQLQVFEPGAQGEHKVARGFLPTLTRSTHWLAEPAFQQAVHKHAAYERRGVAQYMERVKMHLPYRAEVLEQFI